MRCAPERAKLLLSSEPGEMSTRVSVWAGASHSRGRRTSKSSVDGALGGETSLSIQSTHGRAARGGKPLLRRGHHFVVPLDEDNRLDLDYRNFDNCGHRQRGRKESTHRTVVGIVGSLRSRGFVRLGIGRPPHRNRMDMPMRAGHCPRMGVPRMVRMRTATRLPQH